MNKIKTFTLVLFTVLMSLTSAAQNRPNIILIMADDLGGRDLAVYGNKFNESPNIDKLAKMVVVFGNTHVQYPLCGPSRVSLMTGLYPDQTKSKNHVLIQCSKFCQLFSLSIDSVDPPKLNPSFIKAIGLVNLTDDNDVFSFIDMFGTHYLSSVVMGLRGYSDLTQFFPRSCLDSVTPPPAPIYNLCILIARTLLL